MTNDAGKGSGNGDGGDTGGGATGASRPTGGSPPLIQFPTFYTFKAMGLAGAIRERVVQLVSEVVGAVDPGAVTVRPSSAGKYESISVHVYLKSEDERRRVYESFHREKAIVWYV